MIKPNRKFWERVRLVESGCLEWQGSMIPDGYGTFWDGKKSILAHRFAYEESNGKIKKGLVIDHLCRNRKCVEAKHMEAVTNKENILRGEGAGAKNNRKTKCPRGHDYKIATGGTAKWRNRICRKCDKARQSNKNDQGGKG